MAIYGDFYLMDYTYVGGYWRLHFVNHDPGGGNPNDYYLDVLDRDLTEHMEPSQIRFIIEERLGRALNQTFERLNIIIAEEIPVVLTP